MILDPSPLLRLWRLAPPVQLVSLLVLLVLASLSEGTGILLLVPILQTLQGEHSGENLFVKALSAVLRELGIPLSLSGLLAVFLVLVLFRNVVQYGRDILGANLQYSLVDQLRHRCFAALLGTEWRWLASGRNSDHANLLLTDVNRVGVGLHFGLGLIATLVTMLAYLLVAFSLSWEMTSLALVSGGGVFVALSGQRRKALDLGQELGAANRSIQANVQESLAGIKLAKILGNEKRHLDLFLQVSRSLREQQLHFVAGSSLSRALFQTGGAVLLAGYLYIGLSWWHTPISELLTLVLVFGRLIPMFANAQQQYHHWLHAFPALFEIDGLLEKCRTAAEPAPLAGTAPWPVKESISLEGATVCYADRQPPALDKVSITFPTRTTTAIMGASGAGKSSLADVLMGLLTPDQGALIVDGVPVVGEQRLRWRHSVAYVPQDNFLFNDTVRNNLLWGYPGADDADLRTVLQQSAADFVSTLPQGLDTVVGDGGIRLSGGERQRLALARALLKRPSLLILDEATSALDVENEARVRKAIENLHGDLTVIVIGHRLATLEHADQVLVLKDGRISAQGTWNQIRQMMRVIDGATP